MKIGDAVIVTYDDGSKHPGVVHTIEEDVIACKMYGSPIFDWFLKGQVK